MLIKLDQAQFLSVLQTTQRGASAQSTLPILSGIKIKAEKSNGISLQSTDLELSIQTTCVANVKKKGTIVVPGKLLVDIVRHTKEGAIELSVEEDKREVEIKAAGTAFKIRTLPVEDFPTFPEVEDKKEIKIDAQTLLEMVKQIVKAVSRDETRPVLKGALLCIEGSNLTIVATDSYRLALRTTPMKTKKKAEMSLLVPLRALEEMQKILGSFSGEVRIISDESLLMMITKNNILVTRLIEGKFPNYKQLIPKETTLRAEMDKGEIIDAITRVALMAQKNMSIKLTAESQKIGLKAATQGVGEAIEIVPAKTKGEKTKEMAFNAQYLIEGFQGVATEKTTLEFTGDSNPGLIKDSKRDDYLYLIMPIRIS